MVACGPAGGLNFQAGRITHAQELCAGASVTAHAAMTINKLPRIYARIYCVQTHVPSVCGAHGVMLTRPGAMEGKGQRWRQSAPPPKTQAYSNKNCTKPCCDPQLRSRDSDIECLDSPRGLLERCDGEDPSTRNGNFAHATLKCTFSSCWACQKPTHQTPDARRQRGETPPTVAAGVGSSLDPWQAWLVAWLLSASPCRHAGTSATFGIGIDYGDCVVACWALSRDLTTVPYHSVSKQTPRRPFGLLLLACLTAAARGCPAAQAHLLWYQPPSLPSPPTSVETVAKGEATSDSHRAARCLD